MLVPFVEVGLGSANCPGHWQVGMGRLGRDEGEAGSESAVVKPCAEQCGAQALGGDAVSMSVSDALDETVHA
jgi:hypothetical protein